VVQLHSFIFILSVIVYFLFSSAVTRKNHALIALQKIKSAHLDNSNTNRKINEDSSSSLVLLALQEYEIEMIVNRFELLIYFESTISHSIDYFLIYTN